MSNAPMPALLPVYERSPIAFERGEGPYLFDRDGEDTWTSAAAWR